jgi:hypothetical protein
MTSNDMSFFKEYINSLDASYEEYKVLISWLVNAAAEEFMDREMLDEDCIGS